MKEQPRRISRRSFLASGLTAAALAATSTMGLAGCGPKPAADESREAAEGRTSPQSSWRDMPKPIDESLISETVNVDFAVVGVGVAGTVAAARAVDLGMKTIAIEKGEELPIGPQWIGAVGSKKMTDAGVELNRDDVVSDLMWYACYRADQRLLQLWFDKSGDMMDWYTGIAESTGAVEIAIETDTKDTGGKHLSPAIAHAPVEAPFKPMGPNENGIWRASAVVITDALSKGLDLRMQTRGEQLILDENGAVTGLYASRTDGTYLRINTAKGVLLSTGGYLHNEEMCQDLNPDQFATTKMSFKNDSYSGDGIKMGIWSGGRLSDLHWWMDSDRGLPDGTKWIPGSQPWLRTDCKGNRFCNEDGPYDFIGYAGSLQPGSAWWMFFDGDYWEQLRINHTTICSRTYPVLGALNSKNVPQSAEQFDEVLITKVRDKGFLAEGETLDELIESMKTINDCIDADTLKATIARYNELADTGVDEDFGKIGFRVQHLNTPPYYAVIMNPAVICNLDGLRLNDEIQVTTPDGTPIKGLYAAGNDAGGYFGMTYPWLYGGLNCGLAMTFAYEAATNASMNA